MLFGDGGRVFVGMWIGVWGMRNSEKRIRIVHGIGEKGI
jgi:hypothetical protein